MITLKVFADIGELGWTMYLSAYVDTLEDVLVYTDREAMFNCKTKRIPSNFYNLFGNYPADCFGRLGVSDSQIREYFDNILDPTLHYGCDRIIAEKGCFKAYRTTRTDCGYDIVVFPRCRVSKHHSTRNLTKDFYEDLVMDLSRKFKVVAMGSKDGAYDLNVVNDNFTNLVGKATLQDLIDISTDSKMTIGGTSAPPKIALLQGTPTFIIGHERQRMTIDENWSKAKVGFYETDNYGSVRYDSCKNAIRGFICELKLG